MLPRLRFKEFANQWQILKFNDVFERITTKNKENNLNILTISAQDGLISQDKFFNKLVAAKDVSGYYLLQRNDFAYNKSYSKGYPMGAIKRLIHDERGVVSTLYICFRSKNSKSVRFFEQYFEGGYLNREIEKIAQEGARNHGLLNMAVTDFFKINIACPGIKEQEKISEFLTAVDSKISKLKQERSGFKTYKRGVIRQIFNQSVRFQKEDGAKYPNWEIVGLEKILKERKIYAPKDGRYEHISLTTEGVVPKSARYERDFLVGSEEKKYKITKLNDICYNPANLKFGVISRNKYKEGIFSPIYVTFEVKDADPEFVEYFVVRKDFIQKARKYEQGTVYERMAVSPEDLLKMKISLPSIDEQHKIASFLSLLDDKIDLIDKELERAKEFKKGLLQQMFV